MLFCSWFSLIASSAWGSFFKKKNSKRRTRRKETNCHQRFPVYVKNWNNFNTSQPLSTSLLYIEGSTEDLYKFFIKFCQTWNLWKGIFVFGGWGWCMRACVRACVNEQILVNKVRRLLRPQLAQCLRWISKQTASEVRMCCNHQLKTPRSWVPKCF